MDRTELTKAEFWKSGHSHFLYNTKLKEAPPLPQIEAGCFTGHLFFQTSGTSGVPKWVALSKEAILHSAEAVVDHLRVGASDRWMVALPEFHVGGMGMYARSYITGVKVDHFEGPWNTEDFIKQLREKGSQWVSLVPTQLHDLVVNGLVAPDTLKGAVIGGGGIAHQLEADALALNWPILKTYGMTEAASQLATETSVGSGLKKLAHVSFDLTEDKRLRWKGTSKFTAYLIGEESIPAEPWMETKDRVEWDGENLTYLARADRVVKILGELVDVEQLEIEINKESDQEVVIQLRADARRGYLLVPVVELRPSAQLVEDLKHHTGLHTLAPVEQCRFKRTALGKVVRPGGI